MNPGAEELPLLVRVVPPVLRGSAATWRTMRSASRVGGRLPRAGLRLLEGVGRLRLDARSADAREARRLRAEALQRVLAELCRIHRVQIERRGVLPPGPAVFVANHMSYLDPLVLGATLPCAPIAKREVANWPFIGGASRTLGVLFVRREDPWSGAHVLREALRCLEAGVPVLCFPEGTTTRGDALLPFRRGLFGIARLAGVPIVPLALRYEDPSLSWVGDDEFLPHYLRTTARDRIVAQLAVGAPIEASAHRGADWLAFEARQRIAQLLEET